MILSDRLPTSISKNRENLENLDPTAMENFATEVLKMVYEEKKTNALHDLEILEYNMGATQKLLCRPQRIQARNRRIRLHQKRLQKPDRLYKKVAETGRTTLNTKQLVPCFS
jgi:hypothetical protein